MTQVSSQLDDALGLALVVVVLIILIIVAISAALVVRIIQNEMRTTKADLKKIVQDTYSQGYEQFKSEIIHRTAAMVEATAKVAAEKLSIEREELTAATINHIENTKLKIEGEIKAVPEITASLVRMDTEEAARPTGDTPLETDSALASELWDQKQHAAPNVSSGASARRE